MRDVKELFRAELEKIHSPEWKNGCIGMMDRIPEYFWVTPASTSGKYHPACDLGEGGLVRHSIMVSRIAVDLVEAEIFTPKNDWEEDAARIAALFHDAWKLGDGAENKTQFEHPILAAEWLKHELTQFMSGFAAKCICDAVRSHMGKWNRSKDTDTVLPIPATNFEQLIHTADFIASRKYIGGIEEFN